MIEDGTRAWLFDTYAWALRRFAPGVLEGERELVLPTDAFFPDRIESHDHAAEQMLQRIIQHSGIGDVTIDLFAQEPEVDPAMGHERSGTSLEFLAEWVADQETERLALVYNSDLPRRPELFIAVTAWHIAEVMVEADEIPGGEDYWAHAVDVATVFMGFGIFMANVSNRFERISDGDLEGWQRSGFGSLSQIEVLYTLAIFVRLLGSGEKSALTHLDPKLRGSFERCLADLASFGDEMARLRSVGTPTPVPSADD